MTEIQQRLFALADRDYAAFQAKLTPTAAADSFIGVRLPALRAEAAALGKSPLRDAFLGELPHRYYDENLLHAVLLESTKPFETALERVEAFLPYVDNWAVCDTLRPRIFAKHRGALLPRARAWALSPETYTSRFGMDMLMTHFLDEAFQPELLEIPAAVPGDDYYVRMMAAWYYATALAKQWDAALPYVAERGHLPEWTRKKAIQKACESRRIIPEQKLYLRTLV